MIFLANRTNLDKRTLLSRIFNRLQTQISSGDSPVEQVWYHTSAGNKVGVRATIAPAMFLGTAYPVDEAELQVTFDFPQSHSYDFYRIQWVESDRDLMVGWHQDETHTDLGACHFQIDSRGETVLRKEAAFLDAHPLNVFDRRIDDLVDVLDALTWDDGVPSLPAGGVK
ncbi:hypothetical protein [Halorubrum lipolyticum]|uniref:Uncharacterized protein n=1 Tax=Halorubrum lipolyticum DSM 21995 TaxID=1227482 RepID=M0P2S1_9EURY|nr:hypothetical protein [Halorubrum lipolyticum]EMA63085.1 hypothetical protein C469_03655 [Halorubrum lipolyticum DSM 21995]